MSSNSSTNSMIIVAIPDENDRVWKVSSEKVPHLTLLFLGDADQVANPESIVQFVEHAVDRSLNRFYLPVERRDELGGDKADVLYFKKNRYDFRAVKDFRSLLLKDDNIKTAYDSTSQFEFPEHVGAAGQPWIPHLTLGYPDNPAKPMPDDWESNFYSVDFSKIAVWMGDYEGPEFLLKDYWDEMDDYPMDAPVSVAMSNLEHHGVKGQRWGVRKVEGGGDNAHIRIDHKKNRALPSSQVTTALVGTAVIMAPLTPAVFLSKRARSEIGAARAFNKQAKDENKFDKNANTTNNFVAIHNGANDRINREIPAINKRHPGDLTASPAKQKAYDDEITKMMQDSYRESANQLGNKYGTRHLDVEFKNDGMDFKIISRKGMQTPTVDPKIKHAAEDEDPVVTFTGKVKRDDTGHILGFVFDGVEENTMAQSDLVEEFMEHHGVKGMRWGVRKAAGGAKTAGKGVAKGAKAAGKGALTVAGDIAFESTSRKHQLTNEVHLAASKNFREQDIPRINAKYADTKGGTLKGRLKNPLDKNTRAYRSDSRIAYRDRVNEAVKELPGNASGTRKYEIEDHGKTNAQYGWTLRAVDVKKRERAAAHADISDASPLDAFVVQPVFDDDGFITDVKLTNLDPDENSIAQTVDLGAEWLAHHGVKGMKWGQRKSEFVTRQHQRRLTAEDARREKRPSADIRAVPTIGSSKRKKSAVDTAGGHDHPPTEDAIKVAVAKQKLKKSGVAALSNQELRDMQDRMNLEMNVSRLSGGKTPGSRFVEGILGRSSKDDRRTIEGQAGQAAQDIAKKRLAKHGPKIVKTGGRVVRKAAIGF